MVTVATLPPEASTCTLKGLVLAHALPVVTWMTIDDVVPTFADVGLPVSVPLTVLNPSHEGLLEMLKDTVWPSVPVTLGLNEYVLPTVTLAAGVPEIASVLACAALRC